MGKCLRKSRYAQEETEEDLLMKALNSSTSIYDSHIKISESDTGTYSNVGRLQSQQYSDDPYGDNTYHPEEEYYSNSYNYNENCEQSMYESESPQYNEKYSKIEKSLNAVQIQLSEQNKLMEHLLQVTTNIAFLMDRQMQACEKKTTLMERQMKANEIHDVFKRRHQEKKFNKFLM